MKLAITTAVSLCLIGIVIGTKQVAETGQLGMVAASTFVLICLCIMTAFMDWSE